MLKEQKQEIIKAFTNSKCLDSLKNGWFSHYEPETRHELAQKLGLDKKEIQKVIDTVIITK